MLFVLLCLAMKTLSLKLDESVFEEAEGILKEKGIARNRYINEALDFYNRFHKRKKLAEAFPKLLRWSGTRLWK